MSHNSFYYRRKIDKKTAESSFKIDKMFKNLKGSENVGEATTSTSTDPIPACENETISTCHNQTESAVNPDQVSESSDLHENDASCDSNSDSEPPSKVFAADSRLFSSHKHELTFPWLYFSGARGKYFCKYCEFFSQSTSAVSESPFATTGTVLGTHPTRKLAKHNESSYHEKATFAYMSGGNKNSVLSMLKANDDKMKSEKKIRNRQYIECLFKTAYFMLRKRWGISENLADMIQFLKDDLQYSPVVGYSEGKTNVHYMSKQSIQEIISSISFSLEDDILSSLRKAKWFALLADESTDDSHREQFAIIARYLGDGNSKIVESFLGLVNVQRADAESLMTAIETFLIAKHIDINKAIFVGFDGCNTMSGVNSGLQRRFRHLVPHQIYINCRNHKLALCVKHLLKEFPVLETLDSLLTDIWKLFHFSPQRFHVFMDVQESYNMKKLSFIRAAATRWLSHGRACSRLLDRYTAILDCLDELYDRKKEAEILGLRNMLTNKKTISATVVLSDILKPVIFFSDYLQGDVHFSRVNSRLQILKDELDHIAERYKSVADGHEDPDLYLNKLPDIWQEIDDRTTLTRRLRDHGVLTVTQVVAELGIPMIHKLNFELEDGFRCSPVLNGFRVFELKDVPITVEELNDFGEVMI
ncbi:hypothetical protein KUTeg_018760 [Tegillarca granosa]|uniref:DUF4371 domain-containing protein n=1 Tax=Tegillarca granosa TaxID=220873 RepID=A0ABQ9EEQ5_TEGGR|nr:hypothetical protein KUTeg_018760 [Tegillarca granosa]